MTTPNQPNGAAATGGPISELVNRLLKLPETGSGSTWPTCSSTVCVRVSRSSKKLEKRDKEIDSWRARTDRQRRGTAA